MTTKTAEEKAAAKAKTAEEKADAEATRVATLSDEDKKAEEEAALAAQIDVDKKAPEGVKTGATGVVSSPSPVRENEAGVKSIAPTGRFESVGNLIFNEFGQHCGTEDNDSTAAKKAGSFNTQRKFR